MKFHPDRWAKVYDHWLTNLQDWCISRQLWWGHRIPVWYCVGDESCRLECRQPIVAETAPARCPHCGSTNLTQDPDVLDTWFSSWLWPFATMGWTGNKETDAKNPTLKAFYPTTDLVTGPDIIFFWVARMIMAGYEYMGELPFRNVYFTGIIRDKQGRKMSKTLGNSPDPLALIAKYGADALRFGTMRSAPLGQDVLFDEKDVELGRNFCNKLWNACRFRQLVGQATSLSSSAGFQPAGSGSASTDANRLEACSTTTGRDACATFPVQAEMIPERLTSDDKWILLRLDQAIRDITTAFAEYKFNEATTALYRFFWSEFCDWYLEAAKAALIKPTSETAPSPLNGESARVSGENAQGFPSSLATSVSDRPASASASEDHRTASPLTPALSPLRGEGEARRVNTLAVLDFVLSHTLRLFHPFLPFITEELWHGMGYSQDMPENQGGKTIMFAPWPKPLEQDFRDHYGLDDCYLEYAEAKQELVVQGRNLRREYNVPSNKRVKFILKPAAGITPHDQAVLKLLLNAESLEINADFAAPKGMPRAHAKLGEIYLPLEGLIDVTAERARLTKELEKASAEVAKAQDKLNNPAFVQKVPAHVLQEHQRRLAEWQGKRDQLQKALDGLAGA
jgi:valyl-tRNA synthetase